VIVNLLKSEIKHLVYLLDKEGADSSEINENLLKKMKPLVNVCTCKDNDES